MSKTSLYQVFWDGVTKSLYYLENEGVSSRSYTKIVLPSQDATNNPPKDKYKVQIYKSEAATSEDDLLYVQAVRDLDYKNFYYLELIDKRNGGLTKNEPQVWDNVEFVLDLDIKDSDAQKEFIKGFGEESLDHISAFISKLKEENWFNT